MKLWLDDERIAPEGFIWVKTVDAFDRFLKDGVIIDEVSLDNDLGANQIDGYHAITRYLAKKLDGVNCDIKSFEFHTKNIIAREKMKSLVNSGKKAGIIDQNVPMKIVY